MHPAVRAANAFDRAVYRVARAEYALEQHGTPLPVSHAAALRAIARAERRAVESLPAMIDAAAAHLTLAEAADAREAAAHASQGSDASFTMAVIRLVEPLLS